MASLDAILTVRRARFAAIAVLVISVGLAVASLLTRDRGWTIFGTPLGHDYAAFYVAGQILDQEGPDELYNLDRQTRRLHALRPGLEASATLPYAYPPFFAIPFQYLARLPYAASYAVWLLISAVLYGGALVLVNRAAPELPASARLTAILLALAYEPFIMETWLGGQVAAVGLFCFALAFREQRRGRPLTAGLALGLALYKPTLLFLVLPMLVIGRCGRVLAGISLSGLGLALVSWAVMGATACRGYLAMLGGYLQSRGEGPHLFRTWKFVDLASFAEGCLGDITRHHLWLAVALAAWPLALLVRAWWRLPRLPALNQTAVWLATLTATLVINLYVGIYDTILVVLTLWLSAALGWPRVTDHTPASFRAGFNRWVALVVFCPWFSQGLAAVSGVQLFTLVLLGLALVQLRQAQPCNAQGNCQRSTLNKLA